MPRHLNIAGPEGPREAWPPSEARSATALFTGIPLGCVAASYFKKDEDCCYATQWDTKKKIVATQPNGIQEGRLLLRNPMGWRMRFINTKHLLLRNPMGHPVWSILKTLLLRNPREKKSSSLNNVISREKSHFVYLFFICSDSFLLYI